MTSPPPDLVVDPYQKALEALDLYHHAIATLKTRLDQLSHELVQEVLDARDQAYLAIKILCQIWVAEITYAAGKDVVQFVGGIVNLLPRSLRRRVAAVWAIPGSCWVWVPKPLRSRLLFLQLFPGAIQLKVFIHQLTLLKQVDALDQALYEHSNTINQRVSPISNQVWEQLSYPPERDPFGFLTPPQTLPLRDRLDPVWSFLSVVLLSASFAVMVNISARLFSNGPDVKGIQEIILPSFLTFLAGSGLTKNGREILGRILDAFNAPRALRDELIFGTLLVLFIFICQGWAQLPAMAAARVEQGHEAMCLAKPPLSWWQQVQQWTRLTPAPDPSAACEPELAQAEFAYSLATRLDPDNTEAYYGLGRVYEALQQSDQAMMQYQLALKGELRGISYQAYDRLARLFILKTKKDPKDDGYLKAISLSKDGLDRLLSLPPKTYQSIDVRERQSVEYALYKNLGWAYLTGQENMSEAKSYLQQAIALMNDRAAAHCLLAQVQEKLNETSAKAEWGNCLAFAQGTDQRTFPKGNDRDEERWAIQARERLTQLRYDELVQIAQRQIETKQWTTSWRTLQDAIGTVKTRAPAYCLMAQVEDQLRKPAARTHWELCATYARLNDNDRELWLQPARDRLKVLQGERL